MTQEDADELRLVATAFEEQLLEAVAGLEKLSLVEERDSAQEARIRSPMSQTLRKTERADRRRRP
jgi:hypothetical protein